MSHSTLFWNTVVFVFDSRETHEGYFVVLIVLLCVARLLGLSFVVVVYGLVRLQLL